MSAREEFLYARVLFLFLGLPGAILAAVLTTVIVAAGAVRRRRDMALLRMRGASTRHILVAATLESLCVGVIGIILGFTIAAVALRLSLGRWSLGNGTRSTLIWSAVVAAIGLVIAALTVLYPAWRDSRGQTVAMSRRAILREHGRWWERIGLDFILLALAGIVYWRAARNGYQIVVVPEGIPTVSVSYTSFFAPLLLWLGASLLALRLTRLVLARNGRMISFITNPLSGRLSSLVGASISRQRGRIAVGLTILALAIAFASSTAIFNATYQTQANVDAELSNGADVTITGVQGYDGAAVIPQIATLPGVAAVQPMQHRFAYVGNDLQDLYGVDPASLGSATRIVDAFFVGGSAHEVMTRLANTPDGVLVSPETVLDFQLQLGDTIKLRLKSAADGQYHAIPFHYVGVAREFPTAPSDSFLVANSSYIAQQTGSAAAETVLIRTNGDPAGVANQMRTTLGPASGATVRDIAAQQRMINSSLTAVSLHGLTRIELAFAIILAAAGSGLVLALGLDERRRTLAIAASLGAKSRQLGSFVWSEAGVILLGGLVGGYLLGWGVAHMLIKLLTHVFDPPPQQATIPWVYLAVLTVVTIGGDRNRRPVHYPDKPARDTADDPALVNTGDIRQRAGIRCTSGAMTRSLYRATTAVAKAAAPIPTQSITPLTESSSETIVGEAIPAIVQTNENSARYRPRRASGARAVGAPPFCGRWKISPPLAITMARNTYGITIIAGINSPNAKSPAPISQTAAQST